MSKNFKIKFVIGVVFLSLCLFACRKPIVSNTVPVYLGMEVSKTYPVFENAIHESDSNTKRKLESPFENSSITIEAAIDKYFTIEDSEDIAFYTEKNINLYLIVQLYNPDKKSIAGFEIDELSFGTGDFIDVINSEYYIVTINSGDVEGIKEIEIKNIFYYGEGDLFGVEYDGKTKLKLGVKLTQTPVAIVTNKVETSTSFSLDVNITASLDLEENLYALKAVIFDGEQIVKVKDVNIKTNKLKFDKLLINNVYQYAVIAIYDKCDGSEITKMVLDKGDFITHFAFETNISKTTQNSLEFFTNIYDGNTGEISKVELYHGPKLVDKLEDIPSGTFYNLLPDSMYTFKVYYSYDLDDGYGKRENIYEFNAITYKDIEITGVSILNKEKFESTLTLEILVNIDNPNNVEISSMIINSEQVSNIHKITDDSLIIYFSPDFQGGLYTVNIESIIYYDNYDQIKIEVDSQYTDQIFYYEGLDVLSIYGDNDNYLDNFNQYYLYIELENDEGYEITSLKLVYTYNSYQYNVDEIQIISNDIIKVPWKGDLYVSSDNMVKEVEVAEIVYGIIGGKYYTRSYNERVNNYFYVVYDLKPIELKTSDELKKLQNGYIYEVKNDIDLIGIEWIPYDFYGVIRGNGYKIHNLSIVDGLQGYQESRMGLFCYFNGIIDNLHLSNIDYKSKKDNEIYAGGFASNITYLAIITNCSVTGIIELNSELDIYIGGITGSIYDIHYGKINNNSVNIKINVISGSSISAGGIVGRANYISIIGNTVSGSIVTSADSHQYVGGIAGAAIMVNTYNNDVSIDITTTSNNFATVGGVIGEFSFANCNYNIYRGNIVYYSSLEDNSNYVGSIVGVGNDSVINGNIFIGKINIYTIIKMEISPIATLSFRNDVESNIYGGVIEILSSNIIETDIIDSLVKEESNNKYTTLSKVVINEKDIAFGNDYLNMNDLNFKDYYVYELGWDSNLWDYDYLDVYSNIYPRLKQ